MIGRLNGKLVEKQPPQIVIDVGGVGYEVDVSMQTFYTLPPLGEPVQLFTQLVVREDAHLLFGFGSAQERATFRQLVKVSGIGAKTALGILSAMSAGELAQAVAQEDVGRLSSAPGIGKKTAERMVLELRGKLTPAADGGLLFRKRFSWLETMGTSTRRIWRTRWRGTSPIPTAEERGRRGPVHRRSMNSSRSCFPR